MPFDSNLPVDHSQIVAAELRDQFNALKALNDAQTAQITTLTAQVAALQTTLNAKPSMDDVNAAITANSAANPSDITYTQMVPSDPPTKSDMQTVIEPLNSLITALK